ncbi:MAG TPA: anhydro-N-acetylmuramic acid kinase [Acidobacteriaceae bacterium]|nr:anhydro-N-acetylmuramic acid kinase [Acidobacteriaceae bacterium]
MKTTGTARAMIVAGVMSGTSADGVDVAVCRIGPGRAEGDSPRVKLIGHVGVAYPKAVRAEVLRVMEGGKVTAAELSRLNWRLGEIYADCVERACGELGIKAGGSGSYVPPMTMGPSWMGHPVDRGGSGLALVGLHGQTVHHEASGVKRSTWQMGEAAVVAERMRCSVVSDFRPADMAAGGQGAPLVPMLDWCMFRSARVSRVLQNLGGIANLTAVPAGCGIDEVMAFDTGPGNMVIDACMMKLFGKAYDRGGAVARRGRVSGAVVDRLMRDRYFSSLPPKSCGREEFGVEFAERLIAMCREAGGNDADCVATATALTAASVVDAYRRFVWAHVGMAAPLAKVEFCVAGGGAKNATLMGMLREGFAALGVKVRAMEELGVPAQAKEGVAFALLAWLTWNGQVGNVPTATGAGRAVVLGKVSWG